MTLLNLSLVTKCFTTMLQEHIPTYTDWPAAATLLVSAGPPDAVQRGQCAQLLSLSRARGRAHQVAGLAGGGPNPQRFKPMGLTLYYVMTPRSNIADVHLRALADQLVMGLALKTMRDTRGIDDTTAVTNGGGGSTIVMPLAMRGLNNVLRCTLQPTPANEAAQYWQAGTSPTRLSPIRGRRDVLEPETPATRVGRVLMVGVHSFVRGRPRIDSIDNSITFTLPGETERAAS